MNKFVIISVTFVMGLGSILHECILSLLRCMCKEIKRAQM